MEFKLQEDDPLKTYDVIECGIVIGYLMKAFDPPYWYMFRPNRDFITHISTKQLSEIIGGLCEVNMPGRKRK